MEASKSVHLLPIRGPDSRMESPVAIFSYSRAIAVVAGNQPYSTYPVNRNCLHSHVPCLEALGLVLYRFIFTYSVDVRCSAVLLFQAFCQWLSHCELGLRRR